MPADHSQARTRTEPRRTPPRPPPHQDVPAQLLLCWLRVYQCNLSCPHCCVPIEWPDRLDIAAAVRFLEDAHAEGIGILGFTGGEPFLYPEFVHGGVPPGRRAGLPLRQDHVQRRLARGRRPPGGGADGTGGRRLHAASWA